MFPFVNLAPAILFTVSSGGMRKRSGNRQNPVQTSAYGQEQCPSTTLGGSARSRGQKTMFRLVPENRARVPGLNGA